MERIKHLLYDYFISLGTTETVAKYMNMLVLLVGLFILLFIVDFIVRKLLIGMFSKFASKSKTNFDDLMVANKAPRNIAHIVPLLIALEFVPIVLTDFQYYEKITEKGLIVFGEA